MPPKIKTKSLGLVWLLGHKIPQPVHYNGFCPKGVLHNGTCHPENCETKYSGTRGPEDCTPCSGTMGPEDCTRWEWNHGAFTMEQCDRIPHQVRCNNGTWRLHQMHWSHLKRATWRPHSGTAEQRNGWFMHKEVHVQRSNQKRFMHTATTWKQMGPGDWTRCSGKVGFLKWNLPVAHIRHFECKRAMASRDLPRGIFQDESWDMETTRCTGIMDCHNGMFKNKACSHTATIAIYWNTWSENLQTHIFILLFFRVSVAQMKGCNYAMSCREEIFLTAPGRKAPGFFYCNGGTSAIGTLGLSPGW